MTARLFTRGLCRVRPREQPHKNLADRSTTVDRAFVIVPAPGFAEQDFEHSAWALVDFDDEVYSCNPDHFEGYFEIVPGSVSVIGRPISLSRSR